MKPGVPANFSLSGSSMSLSLKTPKPKSINLTLWTIFFSSFILIYIMKYLPKRFQAWDLDGWFLIPHWGIESNRWAVSRLLQPHIPQGNNFSLCTQKGHLPELSQLQCRYESLFWILQGIWLYWGDDIASKSQFIFWAHLSQKLIVWKFPWPWLLLAG